MPHVSVVVTHCIYHSLIPQFVSLGIITSYDNCVTSNSTTNYIAIDYLVNSQLTTEETHRTDSSGLEVVAKTFNITKHTVSYSKRKYLEISDNGVDISYPTMHQYCVTIGMYNVDSYLKPYFFQQKLINAIDFVMSLITTHNRDVSTFGTYDSSIDADERSLEREI